MDASTHAAALETAEQRLASAPANKGYENKCAALDRQIDNLVYELYELTPDEIAIIENA